MAKLFSIGLRLPTILTENQIADLILDMQDQVAKVRLAFSGENKDPLL